MLALSVNVQHLANYSVPPSVRFLMYKKETNNIYFERFILRNTICFVYWLVYSRQSMHISLFLSYHCVTIIHPFQPRTSFPQFSIVFSLFIFKFFNFFFFFFQYCNTFIEFFTILILWGFFSFFFFWFFGCKACGFAVLCSGVKLAPSALEGKVLTTGSSGNPHSLFLQCE